MSDSKQKKAQAVEIAVPTSDTNRLETGDDLVGMVNAIVNETTIEERISNIESLDIGVELLTIKKQLEDDNNDLMNIHKIIYELRGRLDAVDDMQKQLNRLNKFVVKLDTVKAEAGHGHDDDYSKDDHSHDDDYSKDGHEHEITLN